MIKGYGTIMQWGAIIGFGLAYIASDFYFRQDRKKVIADFKDRVNNYFIPQAEKVQKSVNKLEKIITNI